MQLLKERGHAATPTPLGAAAVPQQHPEDAHLGLFAIGGDATPLPPMPATEPWAVPSCQQVLDGFIAGNYDSDQDKSVLEAIDNGVEQFCFVAIARRSGCDKRTGGCASTLSSCCQ